MKKLLFTILSAMMLLSCLTIHVFASDVTSISEDFQELSIEGESYTRVDGSMLEVEYYETIESEVVLSKEQQETIKNIYLETNIYENLIYAEITNLDGSVLSMEFLRNDYLNDYREITENCQEFIIDFEWPEDNTVTAKRDALWGSETILTDYELEFCDYFYAVTQNDDETLTAIQGSLITVDGTYYYVDFSEASVYRRFSFSPYEYSELEAYEITDASLIAKLEDAESAYAGDIEYLYDDDASDTISAVFLIVVFALIPLIIFVLFLVSAIRSKTHYKKLFRTIYLLSGAELIIFTIITILIMIYQ